MILEEFYKISGLKLNVSKRELYCTCVGFGELQLIKEAIGFRAGTLPVRYLGIPLVTRKPSEKNFDSLLTRMKLKIEVWSTRHLSYVGRLQLV